MSSLVTTAAPVNYEEYNIEKKQEVKKNHTYKNKNISKKIDKDMLQELYKPNTNNSDLNNMGDFIPMQKTMQNATSNNETNYSEPIKYNNHINNESDSNLNDNEVDYNTFNTLQNTQDTQMYKQYVDNYNNYSTSKIQYNDSNSELLKKLDNILYLLEEQKEEQNHLIAEELILYVFLGVFVIYVLDSFVKVGKYVR